jgi:hypothetical protein
LKPVLVPNQAIHQAQATKAVAVRSLLGGPDVRGRALRSRAWRTLLQGVDHDLGFDLEAAHHAAGGVGFKRNPPLFIKPGDIVEVEISVLWPPNPADHPVAARYELPPTKVKVALIEAGPVRPMVATFDGPAGQVLPRTLR